jgi:hypothetical protein
MSIPLLLCFYMLQHNLQCGQICQIALEHILGQLKNKQQFSSFFLMHLPGDLASLQMLCKLSLVLEPLSGINVF